MSFSYNFRIDEDISLAGSTYLKCRKQHTCAFWHCTWP